MTEIEYDKWLYVKGCESADEARRFFGVDATMPATLDKERTLANGIRTWRVLSPAWVAQQNDRMKGNQR